MKYFITWWSRSNRLSSFLAVTCIATLSLNLSQHWLLQNLQYLPCQLCCQSQLWDKLLNYHDKMLIIIEDDKFWSNWQFDLLDLHSDLLLPLLLNLHFDLLKWHRRDDPGNFLTTILENLLQLSWKICNNHPGKFVTKRPSGGRTEKNWGSNCHNCRVNWIFPPTDLRTILWNFVLTDVFALF